MWFERKGDARLGCCTTDDCLGQPIWRLEAGGVGSNYCPNCKDKIERQMQPVDDGEHQ